MSERARPWWLAIAASLALAACSGSGPQQSFEVAGQAYRDGRIREAKIALMNTLQADPDNAQARLLQARIFLDAGDGVAAEAELTRARQSGAAPADMRHLLAHARLLQDDARGAISLAEQATAPNASYAARVIGLAQLALGDQQLAMRAFDRSLAADPHNARTWLDVANFRRSIGDIGPALLAADRAVAADPHNADALVLRGVLTRGQYGLAAAIPWFDRALEIDEGNLQALLERAATNGDMGRMRAMLADCRAAHALAPDHPFPYLLEATLALRARNFPLARDLLARTRGAYEDVPAGMLIQSVLAYQNRDYEAAERILARLAEQQPGNIKARRLLAAARLKLDNVAGAAEALAGIADRPDADSYVLSLAAAVADRRGDRALAQRYRDRAAQPQLAANAWLWSNHSNPDVAAVGRLLVAGNNDEALARARGLEERMPGAADAWLLTGDVLAARGDQAGAAEQYRRAANLNFSEPAATRLIAALGRAGRGQAADQVLQLFASENPRNLTAQMMLAGRALRGEQWEEAIALYERLRARIGNGDAALLNNLAWAYSRAGDDDRALLYARRAWLLAPGNPATAQTLGWVLVERGDAVQGLALLAAARRGRPADALIAPAQLAAR
jgi:cellulose synthase operon protein C